MTSNMITLKDLLSFSKDSWKILVIGAILGGVVGLGVSSFLRPDYEATAVYSFSFDYARTGLMTDIEEDQAMEMAGDIIKSTDVHKIVTVRAGELGIDISDEDIRIDLVAERRFSQWLLKVRRSDPNEAALLANIWGEAARTALQNAQEASWRADALHRYILSLESCFQRSTSIFPAQPLCQASNRMQLQEEFEKAGEDLANWQMMASGYFPGLNFSWTQEAQQPRSPVQFSKGSLGLGGCAAGFLISALLSLFLFKI